MCNDYSMFLPAGRRKYVCIVHMYSRSWNPYTQAPTNNNLLYYAVFKFMEKARERILLAVNQIHRRVSNGRPRLEVEVCTEGFRYHGAYIVLPLVGRWIGVSGVDRSGDRGECEERYSKYQVLCVT